MAALGVRAMNWLTSMVLGYKKAFDYAPSLSAIILKLFADWNSGISVQLLLHKQSERVSSLQSFHLSSNLPVDRTTHHNRICDLGPTRRLVSVITQVTTSGRICDSLEGPKCLWVPVLELTRIYLNLNFSKTNFTVKPLIKSMCFLFLSNTGPWHTVQPTHLLLYPNLQWPVEKDLSRQTRFWETVAWEQTWENGTISSVS